MVCLINCNLTFDVSTSFHIIRNEYIGHKYNLATVPLWEWVVLNSNWVISAHYIQSSWLNWTTSGAVLWMRKTITWETRPSPSSFSSSSLCCLPLEPLLSRYSNNEFLLCIRVVILYSQTKSPKGFIWPFKGHMILKISIIGMKLNIFPQGWYLLHVSLYCFLIYQSFDNKRAQLLM